MLTITEDSRVHAREKCVIVSIDYTAPYQPEPSFRIGIPPNMHLYCREVLDGLNVDVPHELPEVPLITKPSAVLGFKWLAVEGWQHA